MAKQQFRNLSDKEFEQAVSQLRVSENNVKWARLIMVEGMINAHVAEQAKIASSALSEVVGRIWKKHIELSPLPRDWGKAVIEMPEKRLKDLQKESLKLKNEALKKQAIESK